MLTKELIIQAYDRNIIVYDSLEKVGIVGNRLITLLQNINQRNSFETVDGKVNYNSTIITTIRDVYLPTYTKYQIKDNVWGPVELHFDDRLEMQGEFEAFYFEKLNGTVPHPKAHLLIAINNYGVPLLGAF